MGRSLSASPEEAGSPVVARPAATVILVRGGPDGRPELFMVRRDPRSRFAADAFVFPGGTLHESDLTASQSPACSGLSLVDAHQRLSERGGDPPVDAQMSLALHVAAVRELFEEAGILLARHTDTVDARLSDATRERLVAHRPEIQQGRDLLALCVSLGVRLLPEELIYFSHWITPESSPRRFDTRFFIAEDRPDQTASHCGVETVDGVWIAPADALDRFERQEITLVSVTVDHLRVLARFETVTSMLDFARAKPIRTVNARRDRDGWDLGGDGAPW
jgi:8-oxo-dGTP pyrophosphatase MutT (NUDIX family)